MSDREIVAFMDDRGWPGLPPDTEVVSLWATLHDADLIEVELSGDRRMMALVVESHHVNAHHGLAQQHRFRLVLDGVTESSARGRGWAEVAEALRSSAPGEIGDAEMAPLPDGVKLRFGVLLDDGRDYTELFATAKRIHAVGNSRDYTVDEFRRLGEEYWEAWEKR
jgi:hypothetical protein